MENQTVSPSPKKSRSKSAAAQFRVIGPLRNVDAWYDTFDVQPGTKYYLTPEERVRLW